MPRTGRPRREVDLDLIEKLAAVGCTEKEISWVLGFHPGHFCRMKQERPEICERLEKGYELMKVSLRKNMFNLSKRNAAMAIFLAKNILGMSDEPALAAAVLAPRFDLRTLTTEEKVLILSALKRASGEANA